jgi:hypothetical protein
MKVMRKTLDLWMVRGIVPAQDWPIAEKLVSISPQGSLVMYPNLKAVSERQLTSHPQEHPALGCLIMLDYLGGSHDRGLRQDVEQLS